MKNQLLPFSLIWLPFGKKNKYHLLSDKFNGSLPWFIWGSELEQFKENNSFSLREEYLLKGILYGMSPDAFKVGVTYNEEDFLIILEKLRVGFKSHDMEEMICGVAYSIKTINGVSPCLSILRTGMHLLPNSSEIKSDYIMSLWEKACEDDKASVYEEILELIPKIDLTITNNFVKECVCYYGFCSLFLLKHNTKLKQDTDKYIEQYITGVITIDIIKSKIAKLLNNSDKEFTPKDLKVHDD